MYVFFTINKKLFTYIEIPNNCGTLYQNRVFLKFETDIVEPNYDTIW